MKLLHNLILPAILIMGTNVHAEPWEKYFKGWENACDWENPNRDENKNDPFGMVEWLNPSNVANAKQVLKKNIDPKFKNYLVSAQFNTEKNYPDSYTLNLKNVTYYGLPIKSLINTSYGGEDATNSIIISAPVDTVKQTLSKNKVIYRKSKEKYDMIDDYVQASIAPYKKNKNFTQIQCI